MTPASRLQSYLKRRTRDNQGEYRKLAWVGRRAAPDCLIDFGFPHIALVEVKAGEDRLSVLQEREIARLRARGWSVHVARTIDDIDRIVLQTKGEV